jgi:hypothetical protein
VHEQSYIVHTGWMHAKLSNPKLTKSICIGRYAARHTSYLENLAYREPRQRKRTHSLYKESSANHSELQDDRQPTSQ